MHNAYLRRSTETLTGKIQYRGMQWGLTKKNFLIALYESIGTENKLPAVPLNNIIPTFTGDYIYMLLAQ